MNRNFDISRMSANGSDPDRGTGRFRHEPPRPRFDEPGAGGYDPMRREREHEAERERYWGSGREMHAAPEPTWRGRNEHHDFWGFERHRAQHHHHPSLWDRVKGVFTGKGPKNYVRSDERIREDVCEHLCYHPYLDASDIEVTVHEGEVTLTGTVEARMVKRAAEECCDHVRGVRDVHNQLRVRPMQRP